MIDVDGVVILPVRRITSLCRYRRFQAMNIETECEDDGRWIAEVPDLPGVMVYGGSREEAISKVKALALRVLADRLEHGESVPELGEVFAVPA
jgi:predicted RNase H-like HicB family nuclease